MKNSTRSRLLPSAFTRYGVTAGAALAAASGPALHGAVVSSFSAFTVGSNDSHAWDINGDSTDDFTIFDFVNNTVSHTIFVTQLNPANFWVKNAGSTSKHMVHLTPGVDHVGPSLAANRFGGTRATFVYSNSIVGGLVTGTQDVGFKFKVGGQVDYGWANIMIPGDVSSITFNSWAYDTTGGPIVVGSTTPIPEPAETAMGLGLLALGAVGVAAYRKRKLGK